MFFGHRIFLLLFRILKLIYFPTIRDEETYVAGGGGVGCSEIVFLAGFRKSASGLRGKHKLRRFRLAAEQAY